LKKSRWLRFSLRTLLVALTLICVWMAIEVNRARTQREAVRTVEKLGGSAAYDGVPPELLREWIGTDYFSNIVSVGHFWGSDHPSDEEARVIGRFPELVHVDLSGRTQITDAALENFARLSRLRELNLGGTKVEGRGLVHVRGLRNLEVVFLERTPLTDDGLVYLAELPKLLLLYLDETQVTDNGLRHLARSKALQTLDLRQTAVSDEGIEYLAEIASLRIINLRGTKVTSEGRAEWRRKLPNCMILN